MNSDRDALRLLSAFKEIKSPGARRALIMLVEEMAQNTEQSPYEKTQRPLEPAGSVEAIYLSRYASPIRDD